MKNQTVFHKDRRLMGHGSDEVALILKDTMEESGRSFLKIVSVEAEVVVADSWVEK